MPDRNTSYLWSLTPGIAVVSGNLLGGWWSASNLVYSLGILALAELVLPNNNSNQNSENGTFPTAILYLHVVMQVLALSSFFYAIYNHLFSGWQYLIAAASVGVHSGSSAIVVAHELIHRKNRIHQLAGKFLLFTAGNIYFFVEHLRVHHKWVGTEKDPATARFGENVYSFFVRSTFEQTIHAARMERDRLKGKNKHAFNLSNYVFASIVLLLFFYSSLYYFFGFKGVILFFAQSIIANFLLEYTNYIEHYGLVRGENERVDEMLSWQSNKPISRFFLIDLSRHSDHHCHASKPYHTLNSYESSPVLPGGYVTAIYLALIPPLWFSIVHKRMKLSPAMNL
jgi:alkane 1-monooxygenase